MPLYQDNTDVSESRAFWHCVFLVMTQGFESPERKPRSLMQRSFELGGLQQFTLTLNADESGLLLQLSLGEALANHMLARFIDFVDEVEQ